MVTAVGAPFLGLASCLISCGPLGAWFWACQALAHPWWSVLSRAGGIIPVPGKLGCERRPGGRPQLTGRACWKHRGGLPGVASAGPAPAGKSQAGRYGWCPASLGRQTCDPGDHLGGIWRPPGLGFLVLAGVWALGAMVTRSEGTVGWEGAGRAQAAGGHLSEGPGGGSSLMKGSPYRGANGVLGSCSGLTSPLHPGGPCTQLRPAGGPPRPAVGPSLMCRLPPDEDLLQRQEPADHI